MLSILLVIDLSQHLSSKYFLHKLLWLNCFKNPVMLWVHQTGEHWVNNKNMNTTQGVKRAIWRFIHFWNDKWFICTHWFLNCCIPSEPKIYTCFTTMFLNKHYIAPKYGWNIFISWMVSPCIYSCLWGVTDLQPHPPAFYRNRGREKTLLLFQLHYKLDI